MLAFLAQALILALLGSVAAEPFTGMTCGSHLSQETVATMDKHFQENKVETISKADVTIPVYVHVISYNGTTEGGNLPDSQIEQQISMLNSGYASAGITFYLASTDRVVSPSWYNTFSESASQYSMKSYFRRGGPGKLHVYTVGTIFSSYGSLLGYASFPYDYAQRPIDDGVVIVGASLPGGSAAPYNLGKTLIHEVGHWVGLFHTFQGGCSEPGDYVFDTPPEASSASGCAAPRHSCSESVPDPIHNFMDNSYDACRNQFTPGQVARLRQQISIYRGLY